MSVYEEAVALHKSTGEFLEVLNALLAELDAERAGAPVAAEDSVERKPQMAATGSLNAEARS